MRGDIQLPPSSRSVSARGERESRLLVDVPKHAGGSPCGGETSQHVELRTDEAVASTMRTAPGTGATPIRAPDFRLYRRFGNRITLEVDL